MDLAEAFFGKTPEGCCVGCKNKPGQFRDEESKREWEISTLCQECQDKIFGVGDYECINCDRRIVKSGFCEDCDEHMCQEDREEAF